MTVFDSGDTLTNIYWIESWRMGAIDMSFFSRFLSAVDGSLSIHPRLSYSSSLLEHEYAPDFCYRSTADNKRSIGAFMNCRGTASGSEGR